jgi:hypothetical protein
VFTTGNGAVTNFPFVPTIKMLTTTKRFNLLQHDMDVNAGQFIDGKPMEQLGHETFAYMLEVASGKRSKGELAGHHQVGRVNFVFKALTFENKQVQLWRNWSKVDGDELDANEVTNVAQPFTVRMSHIIC